MPSRRRLSRNILICICSRVTARSHGFGNQLSIIIEPGKAPEGLGNSDTPIVIARYPQARLGAAVAAEQRKMMAM